MRIQRSRFGLKRIAGVLALVLFGFILVANAFSWYGSPPAGLKQVRRSWKSLTGPITPNKQVRIVTPIDATPEGTHALAFQLRELWAGHQLVITNNPLYISGRLMPVTGGAWLPYFMRLEISHLSSSGKPLTTMTDDIFIESDGAFEKAVRLSDWFLADYKEYLVFFLTPISGDLPACNVDLTFSASPRFAVHAEGEAKLGPTGKALVYSTYLGGISDDEATAIAVDGDGNVCVTGYTISSDFPLKNPRQAVSGGYGDAFVTKLGPTGKTLAYSTYVGGNGNDHGYGIAVDGARNVYITGFTDSSDFPIENPIQAEYGGGYCDVFVMKLNPTGKAIFYSTYLGGSFSDFGFAIAVDQAGNAYVTGFTRSDDFPVRNALQEELGGGRSDAFVAKLGPTGKAIFRTYLGGSAGEAGYGITVDLAGYPYVAGITGSGDFPTKNAFQAKFGGSSDAFVVKLGAGGRALVYSTYLGGSDADSALGIAVDSTGNAYVAGETYSSKDFPIKNPFQATYGGSYGDAFVARLGPTGKVLVYSSYLGGSGAETVYGIALDQTARVYLAGFTDSNDFPTKNAFQPTYGGNKDAFITRIAP